MDTNVERPPVAYARVSSAAQKSDLKNRGGLNLKRKEFVAVMDRIEAGQVSHLIIAHKDRLVRFGFS